MEAPRHNMSNLFAQLGLPSDEPAIQSFIEAHSPMPENAHIAEAQFWNASQACFLREELSTDADWSDVIDTLNVILHPHH